MLPWTLLADGSGTEIITPSITDDCGSYANPDFTFTKADGSSVDPSIFSVDYDNQ